MSLLFWKRNSRRPASTLKMRANSRSLTRAGALVADPDEEGASPYLSLEQPDDDALAVLESASVRYRIAVGPIAGRKTLRLQAPGAA